jgi:predicted protein tyrosine phosphatase
MKKKGLFVLQISNIIDAAKISKEWATHTVSVLDSGLNRNVLEVNATLYEKLMPKPRTGLLLHRSYFDDVTPENDLGSTVATLEDIRAILRFTENLTAESNLLVHCSAGISRSTAVATGILCQQGLTPTEALKKVYSIRHFARPNAHVIALMDTALGLNNALKDALQLHRRFSINS